MTSSRGKWFPTVLEHPDSSCRIFWRIPVTLRISDI